MNIKTCRASWLSIQFFSACAIIAVTIPSWAAGDTSLEDSLRAMLKERKMTGDAIDSRKLPIPALTDPLPALGKALFFTKAMSGGRDVACVSCHHPFFGFGDGVPLPVGVGANDPDMIGPGRIRVNRPGTFPPFGMGDSAMPRNSPTLIGLAFWDESITWDGTVFSETGTPGMSGVDGRIIAPVDTPPVKGMYTMFMVPRNDQIKYEDKFDAGMPISAGHGMFPGAVNAAMRGGNFGGKGAPNTPGMTDLEVRKIIASRIGDYGGGKGAFAKNEWLALFRKGFNQPNASAEKLITPNSISIAIADYERTMTFTDTPWKAFVRGDNKAISESAKRGAQLFYRTAAEGGGNCGSCHKGDFFTDEQYWVLAVPQIGRGKTDINNYDDGIDDWGRAHVTGHRNDKYAYRTPTLLGVEVTEPFGHSGVFNTLKDMIKHHLNAEESIRNFDYKKIPKDGGPINTKFALEHTGYALEKLQEQRAADKKGVIRNIKLGEESIDDIVNFLKSLTDPCLKDKACLAKWIPNRDDPDPDGLRLCAKDKTGAEFLPNSCIGKL